MKDLSLLKKLCMLNGISGDEKPVRDFIINEIKDYVSEYKVDNLGNLIAFKKGKKRAANKLMISAHMDEVGFIVTDITSEGLIKFDEVGGVDRRVLPGRTVLINNNIPGVIGVKPVHLCGSDEKKAISKYSSMYIDIGADSKKEAQKAVSLGDSISYEQYYSENDYTIMSKALDDRAGCFMMIEMLKSELEYDTYFTFVVQEEVGLRGAKVAAYSVDPDFALVIESTTAADIPEVSDSKQVCSVNRGAVISFMDRRTIYDKGLINKAVELSNKNNIKLQFKKAIAGGNDAGAIHQSRGGVRTLAVSLPCRYLHSRISLISKSDIYDTFSLLNLLYKEIAGGKV